MPILLFLNSAGRVQRIQYFYLSIEKMSYVSVIPNCYYGNSSQSTPLAAHYLSSQSYFNNASILQCLTSALRISIANYQLSQESNSSAPSPSPQLQASEPTTPKLLANALELTLTPEEYKENNQNDGEDRLKKMQPRLSLLEVRETKKEPLNTTDDELHQEEKERGFKKPQASRRQAKKQKEAAINDFVVPVPEIDRIETAYLPLFPMAADELAQKREQMLLRRVGSWGETGRSKKDKREIRMLSN